MPKHRGFCSHFFKNGIGILIGRNPFLLNTIFSPNLDYGCNDLIIMKSPTKLGFIFIQTMESKTLEHRTQEPRLELDYIEESHRVNILYIGNLEQIRQGAYELFISIYNKLRRKEQ